MTSERREPPEHRLSLPLLWVVLVLSAAANGVTSGLGAPLFISIILGVVALGAAALLVVQYRRRLR
jgi:hypothetical protein